LQVKLLAVAKDSVVCKNLACWRQSLFQSAFW